MTDQTPNIPANTDSKDAFLASWLPTALEQTAEATREQAEAEEVALGDFDARALRVALNEPALRRARDLLDALVFGVWSPQLEANDRRVAWVASGRPLAPEDLEELPGAEALNALFGVLLGVDPNEPDGATA